VSVQTEKAAQIRHYLVVGIVFAITGTLAATLSRLLLKEVLGLEGSLGGGPWSYQGMYLLLIPPSYSIMLMAVGTLFGKREYFTQRVIRMWRRPIMLFRPASRPDRVEQPHDQ
jgi:hypothetical protein